MTFLHWRVPVAVVGALLPDWLTVDTFDASAWVSLVPFRMRVRAPVGPAVPWLGRFAETNVRTYAIAPSGERGLWFLSLDAARLAFVAAARASGLPYAWSSMRIEERARTVEYRTDARLLGGRDARSVVEVRPGAPLSDAEVSLLDRFLTARFRLFADGPLGPFTIPVEHRRWPLRRAAVEVLDDDLVAASGVPVEGDPLVLYADGVDVRVGFPAAVRRSDS